MGIPPTGRLLSPDAGGSSRSSSTGRQGYIEVNGQRIPVPTGGTVVIGSVSGAQDTYVDARGAQQAGNSGPTAQAQPATEGADSANAWPEERIQFGIPRGHQTQVIHTARNGDIYVSSVQGEARLVLSREGQLYPLNDNRIDGVVEEIGFGKTRNDSQRVFINFREGQEFVAFRLYTDGRIAPEEGIEPESIEQSFLVQMKGDQLLLKIPGFSFEGTPNEFNADVVDKFSAAVRAFRTARPSSEVVLVGDADDGGVSVTLKLGQEKVLHADVEIKGSAQKQFILNAPGGSSGAQANAKSAGNSGAVPSGQGSGVTVDWGKGNVFGPESSVFIGQIKPGDLTQTSVVHWPGSPPVSSPPASDHQQKIFETHASFLGTHTTQAMRLGDHVPPHVLGQLCENASEVYRIGRSDAGVYSADRVAVALASTELPHSMSDVHDIVRMVFVADELREGARSNPALKPVAEWAAQIVATVVPNDFVARSVLDPVWANTGAAGDFSSIVSRIRASIGW